MTEHYNDHYNFEVVSQFKYHFDSNIRIRSGNYCCYALLNIMKSKTISRNTNIRIDQTAIRPIMPVKDGSEVVKSANPYNGTSIVYLYTIFFTPPEGLRIGM